MTTIILKNFREERYFSIGINHRGDIQFFNTSLISNVKKEKNGYYISIVDNNAFLTKEIILPEYLLSLKSPLSVTLILTKKCNKNCSYCASMNEYEIPELSTEQWLETIDDLVKNEVFSLVLTGGEPFTRNDIVTIANYAANKGLLTTIKTNASYINKNTIGQLHHEIDYGFSIDGWREVHDEIRGSGSFNEVIEAAKLCRNEKRSFALHTCVTEKNIDELNKILDFCVDNHISLVTDPVLPLGKGKFDEKSNLSSESLNKYLDFRSRKKNIFRQLFANTSLKESINIASPEFFNPMFNSCEALKAILHINPNGDIYPCITCSSGNCSKIGNIRESNLRTIWNSIESNTLRVESNWNNFNICKECKFKNICNFKCMALSYGKTGEKFNCGATSEFKELMQLHLDRIN